MNESISISQWLYIKDVVENVGLKITKRKYSDTYINLTENDSEKADDQGLNRSIFESLLYLAKRQPDLAHSVEVRNGDQAKSKLRAEALKSGEAHQKAAPTWILTEQNVTQIVMTLFCDIIGAINIPENPVLLRRTNLTGSEHHSIQRLIKDKKRSLKGIRSKRKLTCMLSKALNEKRLQFLRLFLGLYMVKG